MIRLTGEETKAELLVICETNEIVVEGKPTNPVIINLIKAHKDYEINPEDRLDKLEDVKIDEVPGEVVDPVGQVLVKSTTKLEDIQEDNSRTILISVTDHDNSQSIENDSEERLFSASWGNRLCGVTHESVLVNGSSQYASRGFIKHMRTLTYGASITDSNGDIKTSSKKRFTINELEGWSQEQLDGLKQSQKGRM